MNHFNLINPQIHNNIAINTSPKLTLNITNNMNPNTNSNTTLNTNPRHRSLTPSPLGWDDLHFFSSIFFYMNITPSVTQTKRKKSRQVAVGGYHYLTQFKISPEEFSMLLKKMTHKTTHRWSIYLILSHLPSIKKRGWGIKLILFSNI